MFRPRDSHDLRLVGSTLHIDPPATIRWQHDVFNNSVAVATFAGGGDRLSIESSIVVEHFGLYVPDFAIEPEAATLPFSYRQADQSDLAGAAMVHYPDADGSLAAWVARIRGGSGPMDTVELLYRLNRTIPQEFRYEVRHDPGTQTPAETLARQTGSCRDYALLMMEAVRLEGLGARFVTGYLYAPTADADGEGTYQGAGWTHAWVQVYLPGAGWVEFDPTNGLVGGANLIRVGVARDPSQAIPVSGTFNGADDDLIDMDVTVTVTSGREQFSSTMGI